MFRVYGSSGLRVSKSVAREVFRVGLRDLRDGSQGSGIEGTRHHSCSVNSHKHPFPLA